MVNEFDSMTSMFDASKPIYIYCNIGARATIGLSILFKNGFRNIINMTGIIPMKEIGGFYTVQ